MVLLDGDEEDAGVKWLKQQIRGVGRCLWVFVEEDNSATWFQELWRGWVECANDCKGMYIVTL